MAPPQHLHQGRLSLLPPARLCRNNDVRFQFDLVDHLRQKCYVARDTKRWPTDIFHKSLDLAAINVLHMVIYKTNNNINNARVKKKNECLKKIAWNPRTDLRSTIEILPIRLRRRAKLLGSTDCVALETKIIGSSCFDRGRARDRTSRTWCYKCKQWMTMAVMLTQFPPDTEKKTCA